MASTVSVVSAHKTITGLLKGLSVIQAVVGTRVFNWVPPNLTPDAIYPFLVYKFQGIEPAPDKWGVDSLRVSLRLDFFSKYEGDLELLRMFEALVTLTGLTGVPISGAPGSTIDCVLQDGATFADGADGATRVSSHTFSFYLTPPH